MGETSSLKKTKWKTKKTETSSIGEPLISRQPPFNIEVSEADESTEMKLPPQLREQRSRRTIEESTRGVDFTKVEGGGQANRVAIWTSSTQLGSSPNLTFSGNLLISPQYKATVTTGQSPFLVSSQTLVENLNADMVDGKHASDFAAAAHTHTKADITDFAHTHGKSDLPSAVAYKDEANTFTQPNTFSASVSTPLITTPSGDLTINPAGNVVVNGRVGIGTTAPESNLHIYTPGASGASIIIGWHRITLKGVNDPSTYTPALPYIQWVKADGTRAMYIGWGNTSAKYISIQLENGFKLAIGGGNVGIGTTTPNSLLHVAGPIATQVTLVTSAYTVTATDSTVLCDASAGAFTVTLPSASGIQGRIYVIKKVDSSANAVTVAAASGQNIDGVASRTLAAQNDFIVVQSDGANWKVIGQSAASGGGLTMPSGYLNKDYDPPLQTYTGSGQVGTYVTYDVGPNAQILPLRAELPPAVMGGEVAAGAPPIYVYPRITYVFHDGTSVYVENTDTTAGLVRTFEDLIALIATPQNNGKSIRQIVLGYRTAGLMTADLDIGVFKIRNFVTPRGTGMMP